jgi:membrane protease subunit (stomatin/prohibitin family)
MSKPVPFSGSVNVSRALLFCGTISGTSVAWEKDPEKRFCPEISTALIKSLNDVGRSVRAVGSEGNLIVKTRDTVTGKKFTLAIVRK